MSHLLVHTDSRVDVIPAIPYSPRTKASMENYEVFIKDVKRLISDKKFDEASDLLEKDKDSYESELRDRNEFAIVVESLLVNGTNENYKDIVSLCTVLKKCGLQTTYLTLCHAASLVKLDKGSEAETVIKGILESDIETYMDPIFCTPASIAILRELKKACFGDRDDKKEKPKLAEQGQKV